MVSFRVAITGLLLLFVTIVLAGCGSSPSLTFSQLPPGNPASGETLFARQVNGTPACNTCHTLDGSPHAGPSLQGIGQRAATQVNGLSAEDYILQSIVQPAAFLAPGFGNQMYGQYGERLTGQQLADVVSFMMSQ